jgi:hypothetical protein
MLCAFSVGAWGLTKTKAGEHRVSETPPCEQGPLPQKTFYQQSPPVSVSAVSDTAKMLALEPQRRFTGDPTAATTTTDRTSPINPALWTRF